MTIAPTSLTSDPQAPRPKPPRPSRAFQEVLAERRAMPGSPRTPQPGTLSLTDGRDAPFGAGQTRAFGFDELGVLANRAAGPEGDPAADKAQDRQTPPDPLAERGLAGRIAAQISHTQADVEARLGVNPVSGPKPEAVSIARSEDASALVSTATWSAAALAAAGAETIEPPASGIVQRAVPEARPPAPAGVRLTLAGPDDNLQVIVAIPGISEHDAERLRRALSRTASAHGAALSDLRLNGRAEPADFTSSPGDLHGHRPR